jgi:hypothetical protein
MGGVEVEESSDNECGKAICDVMPSLSLLSVVTLVSNKQSVACTPRSRSKFVCPNTTIYRCDLVRDED